MRNILFLEIKSYVSTYGCFKASSGIILFSESHLKTQSYYKESILKKSYSKAYSKHLDKKSTKFKSASLKVSLRGLDSGFIRLADLLSFNKPRVS